jgi:LysR family transcriptional regulator, nitrogen assimilation regulatory protein
MMEFRQLKYFVAVAEAGSFSRAATDIGVAQPALSRQIRQLEDHLKSPLFYRTGRGAVLSPAGELLLAFAAPTLERSDRTEREIMALGGSIRGSVTLGILPSIGPLLLKPLMKRLRDKHPDLNVHVREGMSGTVLDWLHNGKVDIATIYQPRNKNWFVSETLLSDELYLVRRKGTDTAVPSNVDELSRLPLVMPARQHGIRQLVEERMQERERTPNVVYEVDSVPVIKELVQEENLCTLLPRGAVEQEVREGSVEIAPVTDPVFRRTLALATATTSTVDSAKRMVIRVIKQAAAEVSGQHGWAIRG